MRVVGGRVSPEARAAENALLAMPTDRPKPPKTLTSGQAKLWTKIVEAMPANWFRAEMLEILEGYCVQVERYRTLAAQLNALQEAGNVDERYYALLRKEGLALRNMVSLATKLRLTPRSIYDKTKKRPVALRKPWDDKDKSW